MTASAFTHGASQSQLCQCFLCLTKPRGIQCGFALEKQEKKKKNQKQILPALNIPWALLYHECKY
jgi:hypothetical protein